MYESIGLYISLCILKANLYWFQFLFLRTAYNLIIIVEVIKLLICSNLLVPLICSPDLVLSSCLFYLLFSGNHLLMQFEPFGRAFWDGLVHG